MRIILGTFVLVALMIGIICTSKQEDKVTTLAGNSQTQSSVQAADKASQDNTATDQDEYGRPKNKHERRHLFPRRHK